MPESRHCRSGDGRQACPRQIHRFLEPCLLLLVHCQEVHGYELAESLNPFGFEQNPVDISTIYRALRDLEDRGLVSARWDTSNAGPARRVYQTTEEGDRYLAWWIDDLRETDRVLHHFIDTYDTHMEAHQ
jgi:PadR family transcriptional regulator, regulatory protein PadR